MVLCGDVSRFGTWAWLCPGYAHAWACALVIPSYAPLVRRRSLDCMLCFSCPATYATPRCVTAGQGNCVCFPVARCVLRKLRENMPWVSARRKTTGMIPLAHLHLPTYHSAIRIPCSLCEMVSICTHHHRTGHGQPPFPTLPPILSLPRALN